MCIMEMEWYTEDTQYIILERIIEFGLQKQQQQWKRLSVASMVITPLDI